MTKLIRRSLALPALLALTLGISACSGDIGGTATPSASSTSSNGPSSTAADPFSAIDPCQLLDQGQLTQLGLEAGKPDNTAKSRGCQWAKGTSYTVAVYLDGSQPIDAVGTDGASAVTLESHDAVQTTANGPGCDVEIAVSKTASADVVLTPVADACRVAQTYAQMIESKLPAQQK
ncbi:MAG TPA: DUF3558 family protein [Pseudonocardiaceae bacterium]|nr:DUF3558 family protein [Pseudonocardiaceae bacterium]